jgi:hypothetical protein
MGPIGGLLHDLDPPQHYSHMGIFVADYSLIRHCTMSPRRLESPEYYTGSILGQSVPEDGFNHDHVRYGWPGTITQSVEQALIADQPAMATPLGHPADYTGASLTDWESQKQTTYTINALSFDGTSDDGARWYYPLVVGPCPQLKSPAVAAALDRIADGALKIYAHYRFYAYTKGTIGSDLEFDGPVFKLPAPLPAWDPVTTKWTDWSGVVNWVSQPTIAAVCSSFVWQAVQNANKQKGDKIVLDWAKTHQQALGGIAGACSRTVPPDWSGDFVDGFTEDGLYTYSQDQRQTAGSWLHDELSESVYENIKGRIRGDYPAIADALDDIGRAGFIAAAGTAGAVVAVIAAFASVGAGAALAGADAAFVESLIELLYDMPDDVANQICNAFAFDCVNGGPGDTHCVDADGNIIKDIDSENWSSAAGIGRAVSPDNIHMFWDAPGPALAGKLQGVYGFNRKAALCAGLFYRPKCALVPSTGTAKLWGLVKYDGQPVRGAHVTAGCARTETIKGYLLKVRAGGQYRVVARYQDPASGLVLYGQTTTPVIQPDSSVQADITLAEPPTFMRNIVISAWIRVDDVYLTGSDHEDNYFSTTLFVQLGVAKFNETTATWDLDTSHKSSPPKRNRNPRRLATPRASSP